jgi:hypothetical protein
VIRRVAGHEYRSDEHRRFLRDQFGALESIQEVRANRQVKGVLLEGRNGNDDHVGARA